MNKLPLSDLIALLKSNLRKILTVSLLFSFVLLAYAFSKPVEFRAKAMFKEKGSSKDNFEGNALSALFLSPDGAEGGTSASRTILSRSILEKVVKKFSYNATLQNKNEKSSLFKDIIRTIQAERHVLLKEKTLPFKDIVYDLRIHDVEFGGEVKENYEIFFDSEDTYFVIDDEGDHIGMGRLGRPFYGRNFTFVLEKSADQSLNNQEFSLQLHPLAEMTEMLANKISVKPEKKDNKLLNLNFSHEDRHLASATLNYLMETYREYLADENYRVYSEQIAYLNQREEEANESLKEKIEEFAEKISSDITTIGYGDFSKAMEFFSSSLHDCRKKIIALDLELQRQEKNFDNHQILQKTYSAEVLPTGLSSILKRIQEFKHQRDSIELAVRNSSQSDLHLHEKAFHDQMSEMEEISHYLNDISAIYANLDDSQSQVSTLALLDNPQYLVKTWQNQLLEYRNTGQREEEVKFIPQFRSYLDKLKHFLEVKEIALRERLTHEQNPQTEFQGINLDTAHQLYMKYSAALNDLEAQSIQLEFMSNQLNDPDFELSSFGSMHLDSVGQSMVDKSRELVLALHDESNRTHKEKERIKKELNTQKRFLSLHLEQSTQLLGLRANLVREKITTLQNVMLELIQQQLSILDKEVDNCLLVHLKNVENEKEILVRHKNEMIQEASRLPNKWAEEILIKQMLDANSSKLLQISKLVESKNISGHMEVVKSAPLETAIPTIHPVWPKLAVYAFLGLFFGTFFASSGLILHGIISGFPISQENLTLNGCYVAGMLGSSHQLNHQTVLRFFNRLPQKNSQPGQSLFCLYNCHENLGQMLISRMLKTGKKILVIDTANHKSTGPTLLSYLENHVDEPSVHHHPQGYDYVHSGDDSMALFDQLNTPRFLNWKDKVSEDYDWILLISQVGIESAEAETGIQICDHSALALKEGQNVLSLMRIFECEAVKSSNKVVTFFIGSA